MRVLVLAVPSAASAALTLFALFAAGCPQPGVNDAFDGGTVTLHDGGTVVLPDAGFDDAGQALPIDAGPINDTVKVLAVSPGSGALAGGNRVRIDGDGFSGGCGPTASAPPGSFCHVTFDGVEATTPLPLHLPNSISVTVPPCTSPGFKTVRVQDELGIGELANAYTCFSPITVASVVPAIGSTVGGEPVALGGAGFTDTMLVTVGGRAVVDLVVVDDTHATFVTPPGIPGRRDVTATDPFGHSTLDLGFTYESPLTITEVVPNVVDDNNAVVELHGTGFRDDVAVTIGPSGGIAAVRDNLISDSRLRVIVPSGLVAGSQDVAATVSVNGAASALLPNGLVVRPAALGGVVVVTAAVPARADVAGGTVVTLVGEGFTGASAVTVAGVNASAFNVVDDRTITCTVPAAAGGAAGVGPASVAVTSPLGTAATNNFAYYAPVVVTSVSPAFGPALGATGVTITGRGFTGAADDPATVTFGGVDAADVVVVSDTQITATTPAGAAGDVDVIVENAGDGESGTLVNGYRYDAALTVLGVNPARGGQAGETFVTITGTGFSHGVPTVLFDDTVPAFPPDVHVVSDNIITCLTPPDNTTGAVNVSVTIGAETSTGGVGAFTYFNPGGNIIPGARGGPIDGAVYITVFDVQTRTPYGGAVAWLGTDPHPLHTALTDAITGTATLSGPDVVGAQTVSVSGGCHLTATFVDVNATELSAWVYPAPASAACPPPPPTPPPPGPPLPPPAKVRGRVFGFAKEFFDPAAIDTSGCTTGPPAKCEAAFAQIQTTTADEFSQNDPLLADSINVVFQEGDAFFLDGARTGRLALVALAGIADVNNGTFRPRQLGIRRQVFPQHGITLDNQDIELTIDLDQDVAVSLPDAPLREQDDATTIGKVPDVTRVVPFLQLGGEGAFFYTQTVAGTRNHALHNMPKIPGELLTFISGAYTTDGPNLVTNIGSVTVTAGSTKVVNDSLFGGTWSSDNNFDGQPDIVGAIFVVTDPATGERFASVIQGCEHPGIPPALDPTSCGGNNGGSTFLQLDDPVPFTATNQPYHIGNAGNPKSEVIQDGTGDLRGGVTIQPVLGFAQPLSPLQDGVLVDRTLRWKTAPGQQPSIHDMIIYDALALSTVNEVYVAGSRTKVVLPAVPDMESIIAAAPTPEAICLRDPTIDPACAFFGFDPTGVKPYGPPVDSVVRGLVRWLDLQTFTPGLDFNAWSLLDTSGLAARSTTQDQHELLHGN